MSFDFATVLLFLILGSAFIWILIRLSDWFSRRNPTAAKLTTYECGETPVGTSWVQFNIRFYVIALIFVIFDVEAVFLYPCAAVYREWILHGRGLAAFLEIALFVVILLAGLAYVWARGDLDWVKSITDDQGGESEADRARRAGVA
jgi:NADH-quinone oxidoreductase subunit A